MATNTTSTSSYDAALSYFTLMGRCEESDDASYERTLDDGKKETVTKVQLSLVIPSMQDRVRVELPQEAAPSTDLLARWELEESWLVVSATGMRVISFDRSKPRPGEKKSGAFVVFQGVEVREATTEERQQLQAARKAQKTRAKQRRAQRQAEKEAQKAAAAKTAEQAA
jgi:regulator of protease activity HflC (stomatin/prohibitin superfamily)